VFIFRGVASVETCADTAGADTWRRSSRCLQRRGLGLAGTKLSLHSRLSSACADARRVGIESSLLVGSITLQQSRWCVGTRSVVGQAILEHGFIGQCGAASSNRRRHAAPIKPSGAGQIDPLPDTPGPPWPRFSRIRLKPIPGRFWGGSSAEYLPERFSPGWLRSRWALTTPSPCDR